MEGKKWYLSRTIWVNIIAFAALLLKSEAGIALTSEETAGILVVLNLILRMITKQPLRY
ncbi:MAG: hypothetical protein KGZ45_02420 [Clostridium sp.]|nr:hypothetical protein [Clostridium sp.]